MTETYSLTTREIRVSVQSFFLADQSRPEDGTFMWAYRIRIENRGREPVQLLRRSWSITDAHGRTQTVKGAGVIGQQPVLEPGESFEYTSGTPLETPSGFMVGKYHMVATPSPARHSTWRFPRSAWTARTRTAGCIERGCSFLRRRISRRARLAGWRDCPICRSGGRIRHHQALYCAPYSLLGKQLARGNFPVNIATSPQGLAPVSAGASMRPTREEAEAAVRTLLLWAGDDPNREGLLGTPDRVVRSYDEFFGGYRVDPVALLERTFEETDGYDEIVLLRDIRLESYCEHHMVPIIGRAHVAYLPHRRVVGISKLARVVDAYAKRLQIQEKLTAQIANTINDVLQPRGVAVIVEAQHQCMTTRGIHKPGVSMVTSRMLGAFRDDPSTRRELLAMVGRSTVSGID